MNEVVTTDGRRLTLADDPRGAGESRVYASRDADGRAIAVKVSLWPLPCGRWLDEERSLIERIGPLVGDRVVTVRGHGVWGDRPFYLLDWYAETLVEWVARTPDRASRLRLAATPCRVVGELHRRGVVHRDLKPTNILMDGDDFKLADFGAAREILSDRTRTTGAMHTPGFSAPEQAIPGTAPTPALDVYALGCTVFFVLFGRPLRRDWRDALAAAWVSGPLARALFRSTATNPASRGTADDLAAAITARSPRWSPLIVAVAAAAWLLWPTPPAYESVRIEGGTYRMGSPMDAWGHRADEAEETVTVGALEAGRTEVSQELWTSITGERLADRRRIMEGSPAERCDAWEKIPVVGEALPMVCVDWVDAVSFANALSARDGLSPAYTGDHTWDRAADGWRLPTNAEWEWLARAGQPEMTASDLPGLCRVANLADTLFQARFPEMQGVAVPCADGWIGPSPVGAFAANSWGLADTTGNVSEWTWDLAPSGGAPNDRWRGTRGGTWANSAEGARPPARNRQPEHTRHQHLGLRLVRNAR